MTRIIAGTYGGRRIKTPQGDGTRPTSDRVREALFSSLESQLGGFDGLHVLDVFAGSGALGIEALSRGAVFAHFVEHDARAAAVVRANLRTLGLTTAEVTTGTANAFADREIDPHADLVFVDPPYALPTASVADLVRKLKGNLASQALFVVERSTRDPFVWPEEIEGIRSKKYGETTLWYGR